MRSTASCGIECDRALPLRSTEILTGRPVETAPRLPFLLSHCSAGPGRSDGHEIHRIPCRSLQGSETWCRAADPSLDCDRTSNSGTSPAGRNLLLLRLTYRDLTARLAAGRLTSGAARSASPDRSSAPAITSLPQAQPRPRLRDVSPERAASTAARSPAGRKSSSPYG